MLIQSAALAILGLALSQNSVLLPAAHADETVSEKIETKVGEVKKEVRHQGRKAKRKVRNARGNGSVLKDAEDGANDAMDNVEHEIKKDVRKID